MRPRVEPLGVSPACPTPSSHTHPSGAAPQGRAAAHPRPGLVGAGSCSGATESCSISSSGGSGASLATGRSFLLRGSAGLLLAAAAAGVALPLPASAAAAFASGRVSEGGGGGPLEAWFVPAAPEPVTFPRRTLGLNFAVLLMRSGYSACDDLNYIPMVGAPPRAPVEDPRPAAPRSLGACQGRMVFWRRGRPRHPPPPAPTPAASRPPPCPQEEFQVKFWKLRQAEWQGYTVQLAPLTVTQGDLSAPAYFDFISASQWAAAAAAMPSGRQLFEEYCEECGEGGGEGSRIVSRDPELQDNALLPGARGEGRGWAGDGR